MNNPRRTFLKSMCASAVGVASASIAASAHEGHQHDPKVRYGMVHDETKCIGCNLCEQACRKTNDVPEGVSRLSIEKEGPFGDYPNQYFKFSRKSCQQCEGTPCVNVCPTGAANYDEATGIVAVDPWKCVGCLYCIAACPYQIRFINPETKAADKCDFCKETKLKNGEQPACVTACPTEALTFGNLQDPDSKIVQLLKTTAHYRTKTELGTRPKLFRIAAKTGDLAL
ncbi:4Fe-4S dicluster domain-containing protein [Shewanella sp. KX20019]|uniref:4Fe-4S dicluster domain-containing protein n=1 Tax=Shewanella sp. KX20019 TaxID=2803864 RepID=UPI001926D427|nr:4Fe-4S dicluster domain-containing protein [Shewanella sp. KX20019]QQX81667.1 4Fe-4S dicluster domain-containing protein [Shewanella sp. KX20019]